MMKGRNDALILWNTCICCDNTMYLCLQQSLTMAIRGARDAGLSFFFSKLWETDRCRGEEGGIILYMEGTADGRSSSQKADKLKAGVPYCNRVSTVQDQPEC